MRVIDYPKRTDVTGGGSILVDDSAYGTKSVEINDLHKSLMNMTTSEEYYDLLDRIGISYVVRRNIFRGKNLGSVFTDEQKARIADETFKGFFIGDYWEIGEIRYRIADINYWYRTGDTECTTPHIVIVPDSGVGGTHKMNDNDTTEGGYLASKYNQNYRGEPDEIIINAFGGISNILNFRELVTDGVTNGCTSSVVWVNCRCILMNEPMVYGEYINMPASNGSSLMPVRSTIDTTQLALFYLSPLFKIGGKIEGTRESYWLRDPVSHMHFAAVHGRGMPDKNGASIPLFIRPVFGIIG